MPNFQKNDEVFESLRQLLNLISVSDETISKITSVLSPLHLTKGEKFCVKGKYSTEIGLLISGMLIATYIKAEETEPVVSRFYYVPKNMVVSSFESFHTQTRTNETIEALEDSYLMTIKRKDLYALYDEIPEMNKIGRQIAEQSYIPALQRIHQLQTMTTEQRFKQFRIEHSEIISKLKVNHICSYMGVHRNSWARYSKILKK